MYLLSMKGTDEIDGVTDALVVVPGELCAPYASGTRAVRPSKGFPSHHGTNTYQY